MMDRAIAAFEADFEGTMTAFMPRMFSPGTDSTIVQWVAKSSAKADKAMAVSIMRGVSEIDEKSLLSSAGVPVRCIYAASDDPSGPQSYVEINKKYADFDAVFVDGVGHFLYLENPEEVNRHLLAFVSEIENISH
jgi:pimeloyl-ACP methyl ester carboxylesterase